MEPDKVNLVNVKSPLDGLQNEKNTPRSYQYSAKVIAYLNIVYFSIWLPFFMMLVLSSVWSTAFYMIVEMPQAMRPFPNLTNNVNLVYVWSIVVLFGIEVICQLIASFFLLSSTEVGAHIEPALIQARVWRNVTIGYTIANILNLLIDPQMSSYDVGFLWVRLYMVHTVQKYIKQLEKQNDSVKTIHMEV